jgi:hypothetical protein
MTETVGSASAKRRRNRARPPLRSGRHEAGATEAQTTMTRRTATRPLRALNEAEPAEAGGRAATVHEAQRRGIIVQQRRRFAGDSVALKPAKPPPPLRHHGATRRGDGAGALADLAKEREVKAALARLSITRIVIAHRPETIAAADHVLLLRDGALQEAPRAPELAAARALSAAGSSRDRPG